jgi:hypothetical protein
MNATHTQQISSKATSIRQVPALHKWARRNGYMPTGACVLDFGCGGYDDGMEYVYSQGAKWWGYDPHHRAPSCNNMALELICGYDVVLVANVLNVIAEENARAQTIRLACSGMLPPRTSWHPSATTDDRQVVLFSVYEGDRTWEGRETSKGWQANRPTASYVQEIMDALSHAQGEYSVVRKGATIIVRREA